MERNIWCWQHSNTGVRSRISRRRVLAGAGLAGAGLAAAAGGGCRGEEAAKAPTVTAVPKRGGILSNNRLSGQLERTFDPHTNTPISGGWMRLVYQGLIGYDHTNLELRPEIAQRWEQPSLLEYVFTLQPGVKFQNKPPANGRLLTIDDVVFSLDRARTNHPSFMSRSLLGGVERLEAVDASHLRITVKGPDAPFLDKLASDGLLIMAPEVVEKAQKFATPAEAVGTGAFIVVVRQPGVGDEYVRNPDYWKPGLPYLDGFRGPYFADDKAAYAAFLAGQIDLVEVPGTEVRQYIAQQGPGYSPLWAPNNGGTHWLQPNTKVKPFDDARVTRALRLLLDYEELRTQWAGLWYGQARYSLCFASALDAWNLSHEEYAQYIFWKQPKDEALREGRALLSAAGFSRENPIRFQLTVQDTSGAGMAGAQLIQDHWKRVSDGAIDIQIQHVDQVTLNALRSNRNFQYFLSSNAGGIVEPDAWLSQIYHSQGARNYSGFSDARLDAMIERQRTIFDIAQRKAAIREIIIYLIDRSPSTLPFVAYILNGVRPRVRDYKPEGVNLMGGQYERVWLDV